MIVATSGHIDHGKTSLVKALTGIDTDRLPEEKRRGLSIDIGFAYPKGDKAIGFVDVPGHERFVRNMIAGVTAIDAALLVIAADDGPMPQTSEHLAILDLLGVQLGAVALTKIDRVSPERVEEVRDEIAALLAGTCLTNAPVFPVSAIKGNGITALQRWLCDQAALTGAGKRGGHFRMAIDRSFIIEGAGVVVTGAASSGEVRLEDRLMLLPQGVEIRVRGIHAQNRKAQQGRAGERCAINIASPRLSADDVHRGQWLLSPEIYAPTQRFDAHVRLLPSEARALRHWSSLHLHIGASDVPARIALLEASPLQPGDSCLAQLVLQEPVSALYGERFILRDQSGQRTIGGGHVIDPFAPARGRAKPERIALLKALDIADTAKAGRQAIGQSTHGFRYGEFVLSRNLSGEARASLRNSLGELRTIADGREAIAFTVKDWRDDLQSVSKLIGTLQQSSAGNGVSAEAVAQALRPRLASAVVSALLTDLVASGEISHSGGHYKPRGAAIQLESQDAALWAKLHPLLDNIRPPSISELAAEVKSDARAIERLLQKIARMGLAVQIAPNRYYLPERLRELAACAQAVAQETPGGMVSIRAFRDKSGVGRNLSVEALEFFDRLGFTARSGEHRRVMKQIDQVRWVRAAQA